MSKNRDKRADKEATRRLILDPNRPVYQGGANWLGHGVGRSDGHARVDELLLYGATMERLEQERGGISSHFASLKRDHDLLVTRDANGIYRFDRRHLGIPDHPSGNPSGGTQTSAADGTGRPVVATAPQPREFTLPDEVTVGAKVVEGTVRTVIVNASERNPEARRRCIDAHGTNCTVCGMSFGSDYGPVADGYIHVHHLRPLSEVKAAHDVDPVADLRPLCPNCHAVVHRRLPPYSIEEVRAFWQQSHA